MNKIKKRIQDYINHMLEFTLRIVRLNEAFPNIGIRSGFLYQANGKIYVLTAGHGNPGNDCYIETDYVKNGNVLCIEAGEFKVIYQKDGWDFAFSTFPLEKIRESLKKTGVQRICYKAYCGPIGIPAKGEAYGFAVRNAGEFRKINDQLELIRYPCYEVGMELIDEDDYFYFFKLARNHQGDPYYEGSSGAPISDPSGKICSMVLGYGKSDNPPSIKGLKLSPIITKFISFINDSE